MQMPCIVLVLCCAACSRLSTFPGATEYVQSWLLRMSEHANTLPFACVVLCVVNPALCLRCAVLRAAA
jgi:hypothetical protein